MLKNGMVESKDIKGFANDINSEAVRLISLVNDIIKLSELDEGKDSEEEKETTDLFEVSKEVIKSLKTVADKNNISLNLNGESAEIQGGKSLCFEMIFNLCDNAVKYNKENGSVNITVGKDGGAPYVSVKDTGIGVPDGQYDRIFERFYRVDKSRSKSTGGTGLGLSIVKHIALSLGGKIEVKSKLNEGTEIKITF